MMTVRAVPARLVSALCLIAIAAVALGCPGPDNGPGITLPDDPLIRLSSTSAGFDGIAAGAAPPAQTVSVTNGGEGTLSGLTATVTYTTGQPAGWLDASLSATTAPSTLTLSATTGSLAAGAYSATVAIGSSGAGNSPQAVSVSFTVAAVPGGSPLIALSSTSQSFTALQGGAAPAAQTVSITNAGEGTLSGLSATASYTAGQPAGWLSASLSQTTAPSTLTLTASLGSLAPGSYGATVTIASGVAGNSPQPVTVNLTVAPPTSGPLIALSSPTRIFSATQGGASPAAQTVTVTNGGGGTLSGLAASVSYTAGQPTGWLAASLSSTAAPSTLTLTATTGSLAAGSYTASVPITSSVAGNSPQAVSVTFTVAPQPSPRIALSAGGRSFSASQGGGNPAAQTVTVTNGGGGTLTGLAAAVSYPTGQPAGWLAAGLSSPGAPSTLTLTVTTGSLAANTYLATVTLTSPVAGNSPQAVSVTLTVGPPAGPSIALSDSVLTFSATQGGAHPEEQVVHITNGGGGELSGLDTELTFAPGGPTGWLDVVLDATTAPTNLTFLALMEGLAPGTYTATLAVSSGVASNSPRTIAVSFTVLPGPLIVLSNAALSFSAEQDGARPADQAIQVSNGGGGTLTGLEETVRYGAGQPTGWLLAVLSARTAPADLTIAIVHRPLAVGTYTGSVEVTSGVASNSPQTVNVTLTVVEPPEGLLYAVEGISDAGLFAINPGTGRGRLVGRLDPDPATDLSIQAMAVRSSDGKIFVWNWEGADGNPTSVLLTVDPTTGRATQVNASPASNLINALAVSPSGALFGLISDPDLKLFSVSPTTGQLTLIGRHEFTLFSVAGADFDCTGTLYAAGFHDNGRIELITVNTSTGQSTHVAYLSPEVTSVRTLAFTPTGALIASGQVSSPPGPVLFDIDKTSGAVSNVRRLSGGMEFFTGMDFRRACD